MAKITDRDRLLRMVQGEFLDSSMRYSIDYSLDIRGNITIWGGMEYLKEESIPMIDNRNRRVQRNLVPLYDYHRLSPYTSRIYQIEQELDETITDEQLIEEFRRFRSERPTEGFGIRFNILSLGGPIRDDEGRLLMKDRADRQEVLDRLLRQERKDILNLWGVDCPPEINNSENYGRRLNQKQGQVSDWFCSEFTRIGGDLNRHWGREPAYSV